MKILLINHDAGSLLHGMEYRPYYIARHFTSMGHSVSIIGASFSHVRQRQPEYKGLFHVETIDGINYYWLKTPTYVGSGIHRILNMSMFIIGLFLKSGYFIKIIRPDVVIASSTYPLDIFPAHYIARRCRVACIFEVHDLWPLSPMQLGGMSKYHPFIIIMQIADLSVTFR